MINFKTYCINLSYRPDRWESVQDECSKLDIDPIRFEGIHHPIGWIGCKQSHINLIRQVKDEGVFMIIEDDLRIVGKKDDFESAVCQLPSDWDALYLGARLVRPIFRYSPNLFRLVGGRTAHAIIYNNQNGVCDYILDNIKDHRADVFRAEYMQPRFNCFITYPLMATQRAGFSDIINKYTSYRVIKKTYRKYTKSRIPNDVIEEYREQHRLDMESCFDQCK